jgi:hypothetical protein
MIDGCQIILLEDGASTLFWKNLWLYDVSFNVRYASLFDPAINKLSTFTEMLSLGWESNGEAWV